MMETTWPDSGERDGNLARVGKAFFGLDNLGLYKRDVQEDWARARSPSGDLYNNLSLVPPVLVTHNDASDMSFCGSPRSPASRNRLVPSLRPDLYRSLG